MYFSDSLPSEKKRIPDRKDPFNWPTPQRSELSSINFQNYATNLIGGNGKNQSSSAFGNYKTDNSGFHSRNRISGTYAAGQPYRGAPSLGQVEIEGAQPRRLHRQLSNLPDFNRLSNMDIERSQPRRLIPEQ